eukprot:TRINITY_DN13698_c0_g1_i1.p1 TRINITY_DN13698_c0_g1~~TRINITY_DN13698_c0_g1_i1.p1  ORF type:complete len:500 (+),score=60.58 TRINITY_DN13698_c0_g1_i1:81-1502(+)
MRFLRHSPEYPTREARLAAQWAAIITMCLAVYVISSIRGELLISSRMKNTGDRITEATKALKVVTGPCLGWRHVDYCVPYGERNKARDKACDTIIGEGSAGWCECTDNIRIELSCTSERRRQTCAEKCQHSVGMVSLTPPVVWPKGDPNSTFQQTKARFDRPTHGVRVTFVMLVPPKQATTAYETLQRFEKNVNFKVRYPYSLFTPGAWPSWVTAAYKGVLTTPASFNIVPPEHWDIPRWVDRERIHGKGKIFPRRKGPDSAEIMQVQQIHRWWAGFVFKAPVLKQFEYYWKIDLRAFYYCPIPFNPVALLVEEKKEYGIVNAAAEPTNNMMTLGKLFNEYIVKTSQGLKFSKNLVFAPSVKDRFVPCYPSFSMEVAKLSYLTSTQYQDFFEAMDQTGGFFYERWSESVVRFAAATLHLETADFVYLEGIPYADPNGHNLPSDPTVCPVEYMLPPKVAMGKHRMNCLATWGLT